MFSFNAFVGPKQTIAEPCLISPLFIKYQDKIKDIEKTKAQAQKPSFCPVDISFLVDLLLSISFISVSRNVFSLNSSLLFKHA
jgi:hypothetical protein